MQGLVQTGLRESCRQQVGGYFAKDLVSSVFDAIQLALHVRPFYEKINLGDVFLVSKCTFPRGCLPALAFSSYVLARQP